MRQQKSARQVLKEFIEDVDRVGIDHVRLDWPDLLATHAHAKNALRYDPLVKLVRRFIVTIESYGPDEEMGDMADWLVDLKDRFKEALKQ